MNRWNVLLPMVQTEWKQQDNTRQQPIASKVLLIQYDPPTTSHQITTWKTLLKQAYGSNIPVYFIHDTYRPIEVYKQLKLTPTQRTRLIKGVFTHDDKDLKSVIQRIHEMESTPTKDVHYIAMGDKIQRKNRHYAKTEQQLAQKAMDLISQS